MKELKFNLTVDSSALLCPNPTEFYGKAYISEVVANNYRTLPGVKYSTELATTQFSSILKASSCDFSAGDQVLSAITVSVESVSALAEICRFDVESSFLSLQMAKGNGASFEIADFMSFYWGELAKEIEAEIEGQRWRGNKSTASFTGATAYLKLVDGYEKLLAADATVIDVAAGSVTSSNVLAEIAKVYSAMTVNAPALINRTQDLRLYVSANVAAAYRAAVAAGNTSSYLTKNLELTYLDIPMVVCPGMTSNRMVLTLKSNLIYAFDGEGDSKALKAVNLEDFTAEPKLRTRVNLKVGFNIVNGSEIVFYN